ncbi:lymphatic vessel endothelial hyaluronic receptor 1b [Brachionichthys hirsutus]|uniref:lymphatic vessel endothelial hyaluronic receptor 1b n=1 Tax=Brachionichthys hirsutus TaxID=412623 RepID=UPI0036044EED
MARLWFLLLSSAGFWLPSDSTKVSQSSRAAGVFMLIDGGKYTFNFTAARAACLLRNVTMATRAQMERAVQHGLQTCKFGWIAEQMAVVPRRAADQNCGKGKTGAVTWSTSSDMKFAVYCFNASDSEEVLSKPTTGPRSSHIPTGTKEPPALSTTGPPPAGGPMTTEAPEQTSSSSAFNLLIKTHPTGIPVTSPTSLSTHLTPLPHIFTSKPAAVVGFTFPASVHASDFSVSSESSPKSANPAQASLGEVPTALIVLGIVLLLLTAAGLIWFCKLRDTSTSWNQGQQPDDIETEMWKNTDSEMDLHSQHEEEELDRKYSSDITLCENSR